MSEMKLEIVKLEEIKPYSKNAKLHDEEQIGDIIGSINEFGYNDPIALDETNEIIEGHGRFDALNKIYGDPKKEIQILRLTGMNETQKKKYRIAHNKINQKTGFDFILLKEEFESLNNDFGNTGFTEEERNDLLGIDLEDPTYTDKIIVPKYTPNGKKPEVRELVDKNKADDLIRRIGESGVPDEIKEFLRLAAFRHLVFDYRAIADFYANSDKEIQDLMEKSALVIIDFKKAIEGGFVEFVHNVFNEEENEG